jgi:hypothetical protein
LEHGLFIDSLQFTTAHISRQSAMSGFPRGLGVGDFAAFLEWGAD